MHSEPELTIIYFSRGKGRGHAVPDNAIVNDLLERSPGTMVRFASYGVGGATLKHFGRAVHDLDLPEDNPLWDTVVAAARLLEKERPTLVVSHEEMTVIPVAEALSIPSIFITDWFINPELWSMQALPYAKEILFTDEAGYYQEPPYLKNKVFYAGTVFRDLKLDRADGAEARQRFGIGPETTVVLVVPGGAEFHSESRTPLFDLVVAAFTELPMPQKHLLWVANDTERQLLERYSTDNPRVSIIAPHENFTATLLAADVVITKGNRTPLFECQALGVPSISISSGLNPIDDLRVMRIAGNTALFASGIDRTSLADYMHRAVSGHHVSRRLSSPKVDISRGRDLVVERLAGHVERLKESLGGRPTAAFVKA